MAVIPFMTRAQSSDLPRSTPAAEGISTAAVINMVDSMLALQGSDFHHLMVVRHGKVVAEGEEGREMMKATAAMIVKANRRTAGGDNGRVAGDDKTDAAEAARIVRKCMGDDGMPSLRRIYKELRKSGADGSNGLNGRK